MRLSSTVAIVASLAAATFAACGSSSQEPASDAAADSARTGEPALGCAPASVASQFGAFLEAISERQEGAARRRLAPRPHLLDLALYLGTRSPRDTIDPNTPQAVVRGFAATIREGERTRLLVVATGNAPFAAEYEERIGLKRRTAGAEVVAKIGRSRVLSGKIGVDCDLGRIYVGAMNVAPGLRPQLQCGKRVRLDAPRPLLCRI